MNGKLTRDDLVDLVRRIQNCQGTEAEQDELIEKFCSSVACPKATDLIFYPKREGMSAEDIVAEIMAYSAIQL